MRLRQIEVFRAVMLTGSVSAAARLLEVSQPVASRVIRHAETQLGFALFERSRGRLAPTPEARALFVQVQRAWTEVERIDALAANLRRGRSGLLRIAATPSLATSLLPDALAALRAVTPEVECDLWASHTAEIEAHLLAYEIDAGLAIEPPEHVGLRQVELVQGEIVLVAPRVWTSGVLRPQQRGWLDGRPFISLAEDTALGERLGALLSDGGWRPVRALNVQTYLLAGKLAEQGLGFAFIDGFTAARLDPRQVVVMRVTPAPRFPLCLMFNSHAPGSVLLERLRGCVVDAAAQCANRLAGMTEVRPLSLT
ncbi:MAG: LysR family transcriptional regulator [Rhodocyclaceae bacterium]